MLWLIEEIHTWYVHVWCRGVAISTLRSRTMSNGRWKLKWPPPWDVASMRNRLLRVSLRFSRNFLSSFSATISAALPRGLLITGTVPVITCSMSLSYGTSSLISYIILPWYTPFKCKFMVSFQHTSLQKLFKEMYIKLYISWFKVNISYEYVWTAEYVCMYKTIIH